MKIWIYYTFKNGPWGGGNQFLKALSGEWQRAGLLAETPQTADLILYNSHHHLLDVLELKLSRPDLHFVHRLDGPLEAFRGGGKGTDEAIAQINEAVADGSAFQSFWSREQCYAAGVPRALPHIVTLNAPDRLLFVPSLISPPLNREPIKLIATSWSDNPRKGFEVYESLDRLLDPERCIITFVGRTPDRVKITRQMPPLESVALAEELVRHHVYITASRSDPCSNALIEAMHCGLPAIARRDGGHPEIVGRGGLLFDDVAEIPALIDKIREDYPKFQERISLPTLTEVASRYADFCRLVLDMPPKRLPSRTAVLQLRRIIDQNMRKSRKQPLKRIERRIRGWARMLTGQS